MFWGHFHWSFLIRFQGNNISLWEEKMAAAIVLCKVIVLLFVLMALVCCKGEAQPGTARGITQETYIICPFSWLPHAFGHGRPMCALALEQGIQWFRMMAKSSRIWTIAPLPSQLCLLSCYDQCVSKQGWKGRKLLWSGRALHTVCQNQVVDRSTKGCFLWYRNRVQVPCHNLFQWLPTQRKLKSQGWSQTPSTSWRWIPSSTATADSTRTICPCNMLFQCSISL